MSGPDPPPRSVVVGGGISGLAAAEALLGAGHRVVVLEAGPRLGGKLSTSDLAGLPVDEGPDSFLTRLPHATDLCRRLGLAHTLRPPATAQAAVWVGGRLRPLPPGLVLGVPVSYGPLRRSRILGATGWLRAAVEPWVPGRPVTGDVGLGALVRRRYGRQVHERLVDPLVGSINAGPTEALSLDVGAAPLAEAARRSASLTRALRAAGAAGAGPLPPFLAPTGGMGVMVEALARALERSGARVRLSTPVAAVEAGGDGYRLAVPGGTVVCDRVVLAVPAPVAARLLVAASPVAAGLLGRLDHASVAVVALAYPATAGPVNGSGYLVARAEGGLVTACSVHSNKWPAGPGDGRVVVRASVGRSGADEALDLDDATLAGRADAEVRLALGLSGPPFATRVSRWPTSFPQFRPGHLSAMAEVHAALARDTPGLAVAGNYLAGVGIPTCVATAAAAARRLAPERPGGTAPASPG